MRYAVYHSPQPGSALWQRASQWLGHDAATGEKMNQPDVPGVSKDEFSAITASARRYGFHGTLKAPFRLLSGRNEDELVEHLKSFCAKRTPFEVAMQAGSLDGFIALVPQERSADLEQLAGDVVTEFEGFRAPLSSADIARRNPDALSAVERENLSQWGYPYVFERFRFHMTLTKRLENEQAVSIQRFAENWFGEHLARPMAMEGLALFVETSPETAFKLLTYVPFGKTQNERPPE